ncbi:Alcohol dehydrogenase [NADP(+)] A [Holothuria leucospilota]|uniref:Alcohol dehydrogenase [NADP(+)] A n=1 Tax=Holothuria leucospilota TaxID=206669 RepID=A0A9Q1BS67_HOLLE|nr:Alcohol dehydrogenase [NADP(+)] A [Holothuria leucospilota]
MHALRAQYKLTTTLDLMHCCRARTRGKVRRTVLNCDSKVNLLLHKKILVEGSYLPGLSRMAEKNRYATFSNRLKVPLIGLGTWKSEPGEVKKAIKAAIDAGYRHIDGAYSYQNEVEVGEAYKEKMADGTVKREELFVTTKIWGHFYRPERVEHALRLSLKDLQLDYVDLYLMHSPMAVQYKGDKEVMPKGDDGQWLLDDVHYTETWKAMEKLVEKGLAKSIGVSNFNISQLKEVVKIAKVPVVMNQIENHPCLDQRELVDYCKANNIIVTSYSPLGSPDRSWASDKDPNLREHPLVKEIADAKGCTPVQLLIAYHLCQGLVCIPKSVTPERIQQNFLALDVKVTDDEIKKLDTLASNYRACPWDFWIDHVNYPFREQ